jgi:hypothetical protein
VRPQKNVIEKLLAPCVSGFYFGEKRFDQWGGFTKNHFAARSLRFTGDLMGDGK